MTNWERSSSEKYDDLLRELLNDMADRGNADRIFLLLKEDYEEVYRQVDSLVSSGGETEEIDAALDQLMASFEELIKKRIELEKGEED